MITRATCDRAPRSSGQPASEHHRHQGNLRPSSAAAARPPGMSHRLCSSSPAERRGRFRPWGGAGLHRVCPPPPLQSVERRQTGVEKHRADPQKNNSDALQHRSPSLRERRGGADLLARPEIPAAPLPAGPPPPPRGTLPHPSCPPRPGPQVVLQPDRTPQGEFRPSLYRHSAPASHNNSGVLIRFFCFLLAER